jgi:DNA helicase-2/ATP-dependent DNA helicase PcrA
MLANEEMEEERRLAYVGITRAKEKLYLSYAKQRVIWGAAGIQARSRFIDEIDPELIQVISTPANRQVGEPVGQQISKSEKTFWEEHGAQFKPKPAKSGIRIDEMTDSVLEDFLSGNMSIDELLSR